MPPDLTNEDWEKLYNTFEGHLPLQIGIADYIPYAPPTVAYDPSLPNVDLGPNAKYGLDFLDKFAQQFQGVQAQSSGAANSPLGFITTPEYFISNKVKPSGKYYTSVPTSHEESRNELAKISAKYPNIIFMPAGYYHHPLSSKEKLKQKLQNLNTFKTTYPPSVWPNPIHDQEKRMDPGTQFMKYGVNDITEMYDPFAPENDPAYRKVARPPISNAATVKNQNHYYWKGHKLGSYKKSSYFDELKDETVNAFPNHDLLYDVGNRQTNSLGDPDQSINRYISNLLSQNIHPEICYDRTCNIPIPPSKKMHLVQSEDVAIPPNPLLPLAIYADTKSLKHYDPSSWTFKSPSPFWPVVKAHPSGSSSSSSSASSTGASHNVPLAGYYPSTNQLHHGFIFHPTNLPTN